MFYHSYKTKSLLLTGDHEDLDVNSRLVSFGLSSYADREALVLTGGCWPEAVGPGQGRVAEDLARQPSVRQVTRVGTRKNSALAQLTGKIAS